MSNFTDPTSAKYESMSNEQVQSAVMSYLRRQFPTKIIPDPVDFYVSRHGSDPTRYGALSNFVSEEQLELFHAAFGEPLLSGFVALSMGACSLGLWMS